MCDDGYIVRFMHEFGLMVSTQAVGMASHTIQHSGRDGSITARGAGGECHV